MVQSSNQFCGICGDLRVAGAKFCPRCGNSYDPTDSGAVTATGTISTENFVAKPTSPIPGSNLPPPYTPVPGNPMPQPAGNQPSAPSGAVPPPPGGYASPGNYPSSPNWPPSPNPIPAAMPQGQPAPIPSGPVGYVPGGAPPPPKKRSKVLIAQSIVILVLVVVVAGLLFRSFAGTGSTPGSTSNTNSSPVTTSSASSSPTATPQPPTPTTPPSANYTANLPGPGCDTNGGIWTPLGLDGVSCPAQDGTRLVINASGARGYLYLQLPGGKSFASSNKLSVTSTLGGVNSGYQTKCVGLAEQDADTGYAVEYCNDGKWFVYSIASGGTIIQTLNKNVINALTSAEISLTLQGATLTFSVNGSVIATTAITAIQPTKVAIVYDCVGYGANSTIGGNYLLVSSFIYMPTSS